jgi:hypothetical protein
MPEESIDLKVLDLFDKSANIAASSKGEPLLEEKLSRIRRYPQQ